MEKAQFQTSLVGDSRFSTFHQTVGERSAQSVVPVEYAPGGLERRVEQTVAGRAVPERVEPRAEALRHLQTPVHDRLLHLQLCTATDKSIHFSKDKSEERHYHRSMNSINAKSDGCLTNCSKNLCYCRLTSRKRRDGREGSGTTTL